MRWSASTAFHNIPPRWNCSTCGSASTNMHSRRCRPQTGCSPIPTEDIACLAAGIQAQLGRTSACLNRSSVESMSVAGSRYCPPRQEQPTPRREEASSCFQSALDVLRKTRSMHQTASAPSRPATHVPKRSPCTPPRPGQAFPPRNFAPRSPPVHRQLGIVFCSRKRLITSATAARRRSRAAPPRAASSARPPPPASRGCGRAT